MSIIAITRYSETKSRAHVLTLTYSRQVLQQMMKRMKERQQAGLDVEF